MTKNKQDRINTSNISMGETSNKATINTENIAPKKFNPEPFTSNEFSEAFNISNIAYWKFTFADNSINYTDNLGVLFDIPENGGKLDFQTIKEMISHEDLPKLEDFKYNILNNSKALGFVFHFIIQDGSSRYIEIKAKTTRNKKNEPVSVSGTAIDISDNYFKSRKLKENENLFRKLFSKHTDIFTIFEPIKDNDNNVIDYVYKEVNPSFEMKFDIERNDIINKKLSSQGQLFQQFHNYFKITALTNEPQQDRFYIQSIDSFMDILIYSPSENIIATIWSDVTLMVKTDRSLRESEEKYRQIFSISSDGVLMIDLFTGNILDVNPSGCDMLNFSKEELLNSTFDKITGQADIFNETIASDQPNQLSFELICKNNNKIPAEASIAYFNWGGRKVAVFSIRDISKRLDTQKELIQSEKKYKNLFEYSNDAVLIIKNYRIVEHNQKAISLFNLSTDELTNKTLWNISPAHQKNGEDSRLHIIELIQQSLQGKHLQFEWIFLKKSRTIFYADVKLSPLLLDEEKAIQIIVRDISPKKQVEENLLLKEQRWKHALESSAVGVWDWNVITNEVYFSEAWKNIIDFKKDEIENKFDEFERRVHPDDLPMVYSHIESYIEARSTNFDIVFRLRAKNGNFKWINARGKIYSYNNEGKAERFIGTHTDITRYIINNIELEDQNKKYLNISETLKFGYWKLDLHNMIITGTNETFRIFGLENTNRITLKQIEGLVHPEDQELFMSQYILSNNEKEKNYLFRVIIDNKTLFINSFSHSIVNNKNRLTGFEGAFQDISIIKARELIIKEKQDLLDNYIEKSGQTIIIIQDDEVIYANENFDSLTGYIYNDYKLKGEPFIDLIAPEDKPVLMKMHENVSVNQKSKEKADIRILTKHNTIKWIEVQISTIKYKARNATLLIATDINKKKQTEIYEKVQIQELQKLISNSPIGIIVVDINEKITTCNPEFYELAGINHKASKNLYLNQLFSENDYININEAHKAICAGSILSYQTDVLLNNRLWVNIFIKSNTDQNSQVKHCYYYVENIDISKKQIDMLTEESFLFKTIFEKSTAGIGIYDLSGGLLINNSQIENIFKPGIMQFNSLSFNELDIIHNNQKITTELFNNHENILQFEHQYYPGKTIYFEIKTIELLSKQAIMLLVRDISETYARNKELITKLIKYKSLFEQSSVGTALVDKNRNIIICNEKYAQITGCQIENLANQKIDFLLNSENLTGIISKLSEVFAGVVPNFNLITKINHSHKKRVWTNMVFSSFTDEFNEVAYAIQTIDDITKFKEREYINISEERNKTLMHIGNNFAHQFNNLLMSIYGNTYLLKNKLENTELEKNADIILKSTSTASDKTTELMPFVQSKQRMNISVNVTEMIDNILLKIKIPNNINITKSFENTNEQIPADPLLIEKAIGNIIRNAIESITEEGEININVKSVYFENDLSNNIKDLKKGKYVRIDISDTGKGITKLNIEKIYDPFFTTKPSIEHTGLGLTQSKRIILEHGGVIKEESTRAIGTRFLIYLSTIDDENRDLVVKPEELIITRGNSNIMIVDDEDIVRQVTAELLKNMGYNVFSFSSGEKAFKFYKENMQQIHIAIIDKIMPETDGIKTIEKLKTINSELKFILLTNPSEIVSDNEFGFSNNGIIIPKPISIEKLSFAISNLLNKK